MREPAYWNSRDPQFPTYQRLVKRGFEILYPGPERRDDTGIIIDVTPLPPERVAHLVEQTNREIEDAEGDFNERPGPGGDGAVHVEAHTRAGGKVEVSDYWRALPSSALGARESAAGQGSGDGADESVPENQSETRNETGDNESDPVQPAANGAKQWENRANPQLREAIAEFEQSANKPNDGYGERHKVSGALGRYQIMPDTLDGIQWRNPDGTWTEKARAHGVASDEEFLRNPKAQEAALDRVMAQYEKEANDAGLFERVGQKIEGRVDGITVSEAGIMAAVHTGGPTGTRRYLEKIDQADGLSQNADLTVKERAIETRMRKAQDLEYRKTRKQ